MILSPKQRRFVTEYLIDQNATAAAKRAGYSKKNADVVGPRLLGNVGIARAIQTSMKKVVERTEITAEAVISELWKVATFDPRELFNSDGTMKRISEMSDAVAGAIASVEADPETGEVKRVQFWNKTHALELTGKKLRMWRDVHEVTGRGGRPIAVRSTPIDFSGVTKDTLERIAYGNNGRTADDD